MNLLYLIGAPGVGKSTTMRALTAGCDRRYFPHPLHHEQLIDPHLAEAVGVELGRARPGFPGTDTLPLNASPLAAAWLRTRPSPLLLAEGDRLAHLGFLDAACSAGYTVHVAYLTASPHILDARCAERGSEQNEAWRRGRVTKAARLAQACTGRYPLVELDTVTAAPAGVAAALRHTHPFLTALPAPAEVTQ